MDPSRPLKIPSINPFIKAPDPLRDKPTQAKKLRKSPPEESIAANSVSTTSNNVATTSQRDVADSPVESHKPGDFGPAELRPRDSRYIKNQTSESSNKKDSSSSIVVTNNAATTVQNIVSTSDWCPCGSCGISASISGSDWIFCNTCSKWYHGSCVNLSNEEITDLAAPNIPWSCKKCMDKSSTVTPSQVSTEFITCPRCLNMGILKKCKGSRGLKQHYHHAHQEFLNDLTPKSPTVFPEDFATKISNFKQMIKVLKRIPQGARMFAAIKLEQLVTACVDTNELTSWFELLSFSYIALRVPRRSSKKNKLTSIVKKNITNFDESTIVTTIKPGKSSSLSKRAEAKISDGDVKGAVKILSSTDQLALHNSEVLAQLKEKHPSPSRELNLPDPPEASQENLSVYENDVKDAIYSFPNGSASGIDGLCPQVLKDLLSQGTGEAGSRLLKALTKLCNMMLSGDVNNEITAILYGASLCALKKKDGGLRPIAVGNTFRRLTAKLACKSVRDSVGNYFRPRQLGFATRGGCEAVTHATRTFLEKNAGSNRVLLKIDFKNAFNSIERDSMLAAIKEKTPQLYAFLWQCYANHSFLFFGTDKIISQVGAQQGDPAGPMAFGLTIQPIIESLLSDLNLWYLDDGTLAGDPDTVLSDFKTIIERCRLIGLEVNPSKCELYFCSSIDHCIYNKFEEVSPGIKIVIDELSLLGSPLTMKASETILNKKLEELRILFARLRELNRHCAYFLLKNCLAIPKLIYLLRTCPTWKFPELISQFDDAIQKTLQGIINSNLSEEKSILASLPIRFGGIGIRRVCDVGLPAFLSSVNGTFELICSMLPSTPIADTFDVSFYQDAMEAWNNLCPNSPTPAVPSVQQNWDAINIEHIVASVPMLTETDKARYLASCAKESSAWLSALPSRNIGLLLTNNDFRIGVALRLGLDVCHPHTCVCGQPVTSSGIHGLSCIKSAGRFSRHSSLNDILKRAFSSAEIPAALEPCGLSRDDGKRPDGMTLVPWNCGQSLVWDATCTDTLAPSHLHSSSNLVGSAAEAQANLKKNKYKTIIDQNYFFVPFAVETLGPWCEDAKSIVSALGRRITTATGEHKAKQYLVQRISIAIQRGNAASIMGTLPPTIPMEEMFYLL